LGVGLIFFQLTDFYMTHCLGVVYRKFVDIKMIKRSEKNNRRISRRSRFGLNGQNTGKLFLKKCFGIIIIIRLCDVNAIQLFSFLAKMMKQLTAGRTSRN
jgi:hypothetical protein